MILLTSKQLQRIHHAERSGTSLSEFVKLHHVSSPTLVAQLKAWREQNGLTGKASRKEFNAALDRVVPKLPKWTSKCSCIKPTKVVRYIQHE